MKKIVICLLLFLIFMPTAGRADSSDPPEVRLILEQKLAEARTLLDKDQNEKAWTVLSGLILEEPGNVDVNQLWIQAASGTGRANQALAAPGKAGYHVSQ